MQRLDLKTRFQNGQSYFTVLVNHNLDLRLCEALLRVRETVKYLRTLSNQVYDKSINLVKVYYTIIATDTQPLQQADESS
jgi:hypothetical protein